MGFREQIIAKIGLRALLRLERYDYIKRLAANEPGVMRNLVEALRDARLAPHAVEALLNIGEPAIGSLVDALRWGYPHAGAALARLGEIAIDPLLRILTDPDLSLRDYRVCWRAAEALAAIGKPPGKPFIQALMKGKVGCDRLHIWHIEVGVPVLQALWAALQDPDGEVRIRSAQALGHMPKPESVPYLIAALKDENAKVQVSAAESLGMTRDPRAVEDLMLALDDQNDVVRATAAQALGKIGDSKAIGPLVDAWVNGRLAWLDWAFGKQNGSRPIIVSFGTSAVAPLRAVYQSIAEKQRDEIFCALVQVGDPPLDSLAELLKGGDKALCKKIAAALGELGTEGVVRPLVEALRHEDPDVRESAARALDRIHYDLPCQEDVYKALVNALMQEVVGLHYQFDLADALFRLRGPSEVLVEALAHGHPWIRRRIAEILYVNHKAWKPKTAEQLASFKSAWESWRNIDSLPCPFDRISDETESWNERT